MEPVKMAELSLLYDYYGPLLTKHQQKILNLCCNNDLSFAEIAETFNLSRQAVYDILKQSQKKLYFYEEKLKILKERKVFKKNIDDLIEEVKEIEQKKDLSLKKMNKIKVILTEVTKNI
ncbi:MAG: DNA-binding protein [Candidatus Firestonebacteria bacterium]|nr:DNA-binding protein [Candidatus Firestonebacteria bacterium]